MITKKLANYWCLIGSIPLILFLLVAIPTIFYVKKFSEYVNAEYCDTKSCKDLADIIGKMGDQKDACKSFSAHVCKPKQDYAFDALSKMAKEVEVLESKPDNPGLATSTFAKQFTTACQGKFEPVEDIDTGIPDIKGLDYDGFLDPAKLSGQMSVYGIDGLVRAVAVRGNTSGNQEVKTILELSAPIEDMFVYQLLSMLGMKLKEVVLQYNSDDDGKLGNFEKFVQNYSMYTISNTLTTHHNMGKLMTIGQIKDLPKIGRWNWQEYFSAFDSLNLDYLQDDSMVRLAHPKYLLGLDAFLESWHQADPNFGVILNVMLQTIAHLQSASFLTIKKEPPKPVRTALCVMLAARLFPASMDHLLYYQRRKQFGAANGINPGGTKDPEMMKFLRSEVQGMLDSLTFSYSLSQSVTEENRVHFFRRVSNMMVAPGFLNDSTGAITDAALKELAENVPSGDEIDLYGATQQARQKFPGLYWKQNSSYLMFRNQFSPLYATYTPSLNHLYVPMGVFTKPIFRNSQKNRIFAATSGYLVMSGVMKALTLSGSMVVDGLLTPENWVGYSWSRKMERYASCIAPDRKKNDTIESIMDLHLLAAVVPAYRYYKRMVLHKAFPRPEFRIDWVSHLSSTQLFFYDWALLHCGSEMGKELIDLTAKNNPYFHQSFQCEKGNPMYKDKPCLLWNTTRRNY